MRVVLKKLGLKRASSNEASNDRALLQEGKESSGTVGASLPDAPDESLKAAPPAQPAEEMEEPQPQAAPIQNEYGEVFTDEFQGPDTSSLTAFLVSLLSYTPEPPDRPRPSHPSSPRTPNTPASASRRILGDHAEASRNTTEEPPQEGETRRSSAANQALYSRVHDTAIRAHEAVARAEEAISTSRVRPDGPGAASPGGAGSPGTTPPGTSPAARAHEAAVRAKETAARAARSDTSSDDSTDWQVVNERDVPASPGFWQPSEIGALAHNHMPGKIRTVTELVIPSKVISRLDGEPARKSPPGKPPDLSEPSMMLKEGMRALLCTALPALAIGRQWVLLYSTERHGISLHTLYRNSANAPGATLLVVQDTQGAIFGGFTSQPYNPSGRRKYQGGNDCFVFAEKDGEPRLYRSTGDNRYFLLCTNDALAFGGGDHFALRIDEELLHGSSGPCETFGNPCLASSEEFGIRYVEVWGFAHNRRFSNPA